MQPADVILLTKTTPVPDLPELIGALAQATAIANMRLLTPASVPNNETPLLVDRREAARILGVSTYFLEGKRLPCQQRAGKKILYNRARLLKYVEQGHVPYEDRLK